MIVDGVRRNPQGKTNRNVIKSNKSRCQVLSLTGGSET